MFQLQKADDVSNSVKFSIIQSTKLLRNINFEISDKYKTFRIIYFILYLFIYLFKQLVSRHNVNCTKINHTEESQERIGHAIYTKM